MHGPIHIICEHVCIRRKILEYWVDSEYEGNNESEEENKT
jgi:hypothetical protein